MTNGNPKSRLDPNVARLQSFADSVHQEFNTHVNWHKQEIETRQAAFHKQFLWQPEPTEELVPSEEPDPVLKAASGDDFGSSSAPEPPKGPTTLSSPSEKTTEKPSDKIDNLKTLPNSTPVRRGVRALLRGNRTLKPVQRALRDLEIPPRPANKPLQIHVKPETAAPKPAAPVSPPPTEEPKTSPQLIQPVKIPARPVMRQRKKTRFSFKKLFDVSPSFSQDENGDETPRK